MPLPPPKGTAVTSPRELLAFKLGAEEHGIDTLRTQESRSREEPARIANAPALVKGVVNLRGVIIQIVDMQLKFRREAGAGPAPARMPLAKEPL